jgi:hypothetical protein
METMDKVVGSVFTLAFFIRYRQWIKSLDRSEPVSRFATVERWRSPCGWINCNLNHATH